MKNKLFFAMMIIGFGTNAQVGISGGLSSLKAFGVPKLYGGIHLGVEIPRDDQVSFYGRLTTYLPNRDELNTTNYTFVTARELTTIPYQQIVYYSTKMNYVALEGGSRYYIGEGYDSGFGAYGGSNFSVIFNSVKRDYDEFDEVKYALPATEESKGAIFNVGVGLGGGLKYTVAGIGSLYFDVNFSYLLLSQPSNNTAATAAQNLYSPLLFNFALGFRKELY
ncbi:MAG: hypothetical protein ACK45H_02565 [Bacteroidota bacterium]|jgi:hypothetical protein